MNDRPATASALPPVGGHEPLDLPTRDRPGVNAAFAAQLVVDLAHAVEPATQIAVAMHRPDPFQHRRVADRPRDGGRLSAR